MDDNDEYIEQCPNEGDVAAGSAYSVHLDLNGCSPSDLAKYLLNARFEGNTTSTATFFLECATSLPDAEEICARLLGGAGGDDDDDDDDEDGEEEDEDEDEEDDGIFDRVEDALRPSIALPVDDDGVKGGVTGTLHSVEVSGTVPRSKFDLSARRGGIVLTNKKDETVMIGADHVEHVLMFPKPEDCRYRTTFGGGAGSRGREVKGDAGEGKTTTTTTTALCKKRNGSVVLIVLKQDCRPKITATAPTASPPPSFRGRELRHVCFQLPPYSLDKGEGSDRDIEGEWAELFASSLLRGSGEGGNEQERRVARVANPAHRIGVNGAAAGGGSGTNTNTNPDGTAAFRSDEGNASALSVTTGGVPFIRCYHGVNDGVLFPLEQGLLFYKPPLFVHRSRLHSVSCGRGSSSNGSRYVDLRAVLRGDEDKDDSEGDGVGRKAEVEFTNIHREELRVLNRYINHVLFRAMARDAADTGKDGCSVLENQEDAEVAAAEVVAEYDNDDDGEGDGSPSSGGRKKRSRRAASREARAATKAQLAALEALKAARPPSQSGRDWRKENDDDDDVDDEDEEDPDEFRVEDEDETDSDDDDDTEGEDDNDDGLDSASFVEEEEDSDGNSDDDETESESGEDGSEDASTSRPTKRPKKR